MLQCDNNNKRQPDNPDTDTEEDIELEEEDASQCSQPKVRTFLRSNVNFFQVIGKMPSK